MSPRARGLLAALALCCAAAACRSAAPDREPADQTSPRGAGPLPSQSAAPLAQADTPREPEPPVVVVSAPPTLRALMTQGFDLGSQLFEQSATTTRDLARHAAYRALVETLSADLERDRGQDRTAGVGMRHAHRQFDAHWLDSDQTRFELIAIVNRLDRQVFAPEHCGELRLVYRLAYTADTPTGRIDSRLPMTVNLVRFQARDRSGNCRETANAWVPPGPMQSELEWLRSERGPLAATRLAAAPLKSVEVNFQSVRWPSTVRPSLGGHAEYTLRVFHRQPGPPYLVPAKLENTIDAARLRNDAALARELRDWLALPQSLDALDAGTLSLPEKFLAERAVSVSPHGLDRLANRPYAALLAPRDFEGLDWTRYATLRSPAALIRRLDGLSCPGCHQSRSLAGFHLLGEDAPDKAVDALAVPMSPHFHAEIWRRREYVAALAAGQVPAEARPPAEREGGALGLGARCGLGDPSYESWTCAAGLSCAKTSGSELGTCIASAGPTVGDPCESGPITRNAPHLDGARLTRTACQDGRVCEANSVGFPGGMCAGACDDLPEGSVCGGIALLVEFNSCLANGRSFERCIEDNTRPGALRACSFHEPCRDDYVCARTPNGGACMPPYFLFQLRVDGHPI